MGLFFLPPSQFVEFLLTQVYSERREPPDGGALETYVVVVSQ